MTDPGHSCSGFDGADPGLDEEFRTILDAVFCSCLGDMQDGAARLRRDLFRLTEMEGHTPAVAAHRLGLGIPEAEETLARIRRDIAVLLALGLFMPPAGEAANAPRSRNCRCGNTAMARRRAPAVGPSAPGSDPHQA